MDPVVQIFVTIAGAFLASTGFWAYMMKRMDKKDLKTEMLIGLGHDRIISLCSFYLDRGDWITRDEYENLEYLYKPYEKMGGNGTTKRFMDEVKCRLRIVGSIIPQPNIPCKGENKL
jgi:hypothetical protein